MTRRSALIAEVCHAAVVYGLLCGAIWGFVVTHREQAEKDEACRLAIAALKEMGR